MQIKVELRMRKRFLGREALYEVWGKHGDIGRGRQEIQKDVSEINSRKNEDMEV